VKIMNDVAFGASRRINRYPRALFALLAATLLIASTILDAGAAVTLVKFEADWQDDGSVLVVWESSSELDTTAYFLYRAGSLSGPWTDYVDFEPAAGNEFTGASYTFVDNDVTPGNSYYYRLEETAADGSSSFFGPISARSPGTSSATATSTANGTSRPNVVPTATQQFTNTPPPAGTGSAAPTPTRPPVQAAAPVRATPTRALTALVTTPTPIGGAVPASAPSTPTFVPTATPEPTNTATATQIPTVAAAQATPSPTVQQLAAAPKETSQPLLEGSAVQLAPAAGNEAPQRQAPDSRLVLFLGGGALVAAIALAAVAVLIWRWRAG
jgi:hypothetical protein